MVERKIELTFVKLGAAYYGMWQSIRRKNGTNVRKIRRRVLRYVAVHDIYYIRPSVDGLCRDGPSEISRDPSTKRLQTRLKRLGWL